MMKTKEQATVETKMKPMVETREQTMKKIEYHIPHLTDEDLRLVSAFIRGLMR